MFDNQIRKISYINCQKDGHGSEPMSRVCIDDQCKDKTLICSLCQELNHKKHKTIPLKVLLTKINNECSFDKAGINPLYFTNIIDETRGSFFNLIHQKRKQANDLLDQLQDIGKMYFNKIQQTALSLLQIDNPLKYLNINQANIKKLKQYLCKMIKLVNFDENNNVTLQKRLKNLIDDCKNKQKKIKDIINPTLNSFQKSLQDTMKLLDHQIIFNNFKNPIFTWSPDLKGDKIKIMDTVAQQTGMESSGKRFALLSQCLNDYGNKKITWGIKLKKFAVWIGVGICLKGVIQKADYFFNYTNIGHGSYLISSNGYTWSHSVKQFNSTFKTFLFTVNDTVYMQYDPIDNKLRFKKNTGADKFELTIVPPPVGDVYHPCVNLCSTGDAVQIINPGIPLS